MAKRSMSLDQALSAARAEAAAITQRQQALAQQLISIRDETDELLAGLSATGVETQGKRRGRPPGSKNKRGPGRPKGSGKRKRTMSAATRAKMRAAAKKRWAAVKKQGKAKGSTKRKGRKGTDEQDVGNG
jgi:hypothetical protein